MDQNLKKIFHFTSKYESHIVGNVTFNVLYALFSTLSFVALFPLMEVLFKMNESVYEKPQYEGVFEIGSYLKKLLEYYVTHLTEVYGVQYALLLTVTLVISTFLFKNLFNYAASQHLMKIKNGVLHDLREKMYAKIISLPVSYYSEKRKGDIMARMLGDVNEVKNSFFLILELIIKEPLTIVFAIVAMLKISFELTLFVFVFIPISGFIISKIGKSLKSKSTRLQEENGYLISVVEETLTGLKVVKSYNAEPYFNSIFMKSIDRLMGLDNAIGKKNNLASPMSEFLGIVVIAVLLWYGGHLVLVDKSLNGALFIVYLGLAYNILTPAKAISKASYQVKNGLAAAERVFEVLEVENTIEDQSNAIDKTTFDQGISLKNITFKYDEYPVLKNFSVDIKKGQTVALVGQSGSGKSTIANLLTRFYDVEDGEILIDGIPVKSISLQSLRNLMGLVTQDSILFNDSIRANISLGKQNATDDELWEALRIANAADFVKQLPLGLDTPIGDAGGKLSGGQKQRLSIARAVLKNPPIMILDEATSALDTESERLVQDALEKMMQNRTSVVIAHRLSTIQKADLICVMHQGQIIEQGTHESLLAKDGMYAKLVMMQSFE
jgi:ATP-binding cassette, subfamily B, bacterial MsbA